MAADLGPRLGDGPAGEGRPGNGRTAATRNDLADLAAPRRVFKRKKRRGLMLALKFGLPFVAVVGVAFIVIWSRTHRSTIVPLDVTADVNKQGSDVKVARVQYDGVDAQNRPFSITADSAVQPQSPPPPPKPISGLGADDSATRAAKPGQQGAAANAANADNIINLHKLVADMTMSDGAWVAVTADNGVYDRNAGTVDLSGNVILLHDAGLTFETDAATVDFKNDVASGNQPVEGSKPDAELAAQGFEVRDGGQTVLFTGRAYLKLYPKSGAAASGPKG